MTTNTGKYQETRYLNLNGLDWPYRLTADYTVDGNTVILAGEIKAESNGVNFFPALPPQVQGTIMQMIRKELGDPNACPWKYNQQLKEKGPTYGY